MEEGAGLEAAEGEEEAAASAAALFALLASSAFSRALASRSLCDGRDSTLLPPLS